MWLQPYEPSSGRMSSTAIISTSLAPAGVGCGGTYGGGGGGGGGGGAGVGGVLVDQPATYLGWVRQQAHGSQPPVRVSNGCGLH